MTEEEEKDQVPRPDTLKKYGRLYAQIWYANDRITDVMEQAHFQKEELTIQIIKDVKLDLERALDEIKRMGI